MAQHLQEEEGGNSRRPELHLELPGGSEDAGDLLDPEASGEGRMDCVFLLQGNRPRRTCWRRRYKSQLCDCGTCEVPRSAVYTGGTQAGAVPVAGRRPMSQLKTDRES